jgi:hypothetical protein
MHHFDHLLSALLTFVVSLLAIKQSLVRLSKLDGERRILMRKVFSSIFWGVIAASGAILAFVVWLATHDDSSLLFAVVAVVLSAVSGFYVVRIYVPLRKLGS